MIRALSLYRHLPFKRISAIRGANSSARFFNTSWSRLPKGCSVTAKGYSGIPPSLAMATPLVTKGSVQITAAGIPLFSNSIPSCTLHDEHDPQSPDAVITTSQTSDSSANKFGGHGREALPLLSGTARFSLKLSDRTS